MFDRCSQVTYLLGLCSFTCNIIPGSHASICSDILRRLYWHLTLFTGERRTPWLSNPTWHYHVILIKLQTKWNHGLYHFISLYVWNLKEKGKIFIKDRLKDRLFGWQSWFIMCLCLKYLIVFNSVVAEALTLAEALRDLLRITIWINTREHWQVPVYLGERVGTAHVGLPNRTARLGTVTTLVINWAFEKTKDNM